MPYYRYHNSVLYHRNSDDPSALRLVQAAACLHPRHVCLTQIPKGRFFAENSGEYCCFGLVLLAFVMHNRSLHTRVANEARFVQIQLH